MHAQGAAESTLGEMGSHHQNTKKRRCGPSQPVCFVGSLWVEFACSAWNRKLFKGLEFPKTRQLKSNQLSRCATRTATVPRPYRVRRTCWLLRQRPYFAQENIPNSNQQSRSLAEIQIRASSTEPTLCSSATFLSQTLIWNSSFFPAIIQRVERNNLKEF